MGITKIIKKSAVVEIIFAIASVRGHCPVIGFTEEVEKAWEQLKRKHCIKKRKIESLQKLASTSQVLNSKLNDSCSFATFPDEHRVNNNLSKRPQKSNTFSDIEKVFNKFKNLEELEIQGKKDDVYNKNWIPTKYSKMDAGYGRPKPGTLSEARAKKASKHIAREMLQLCEVIQDYGKPGTSGKVEITFKDLFNVYTYISDKVVGILLRARKHNMVTFEGEMLFQRRDDHVIITLLLTQDDIKAALITAQTNE